MTRLRVSYGCRRRPPSDGEVGNSIGTKFMRERSFLDSSAVFGDADVMLGRIDRDGYLFFRGFFDRTFILALRRQLLEIAARHDFLDRRFPLEEGVANLEAACIEPEVDYVKALREMYVLEEIHDLKHHPRILDLFHRILGETVLPHPMIVIRNVFPQKREYTTPAHQDFVHNQGAEDTYSFWMPLCDCPEEMGCVEVSAGSHKGGVYEFRMARAAGNLEIIESFDGQWVGNGIEAGDVLIFHSMTVHRAFPNRSNRLRQSVDMRFQRASEPIIEKELNPYFATQMTWDDVQREWKSDRYKDFWERYDLKVVPYDRVYLDHRDELAFEAAERGNVDAIETLMLIEMRDPDAAKRKRAGELLARLQSRLLGRHILRPPW